VKGTPSNFRNEIVPIYDSGCCQETVIDASLDGEVDIFYKENGTLVHTWKPGLFWRQSVFQCANEEETTLSLESDNSGDTHFVHGNPDHFYYSYKYNSQNELWWRTELFDEHRSNLYCGSVLPLASDHSGAIIFPFSPYPDKPFSLGRFDGNSLEYETIEARPFPEGTRYMEPYVATDSNGHVHVAYLLGSGTEDHQLLKYANNLSGEWETDVMYDDNYVTGFTWIGIDSNDNVHILFRAFDGVPGYLTAGYLKYLTNKSGEWNLQTICPTDDLFLGWYVPFLDIDDNLNIFYETTANQTQIFRLIYLDDEWNSELAINVSGYPVGAAFDFSGTSHLIYSVRNDLDSNVSLHHAIQVNNDWESELVAQDVFSGHRGITFFITENNLLHLVSSGQAMIDNNSNSIQDQMLYFSKKAGEWNSVVIGLADVCAASVITNNKMNVLDGSGWLTTFPLDSLQ